MKMCVSIPAVVDFGEWGRAQKIHGVEFVVFELHELFTKIVCGGDL